MPYAVCSYCQTVIMRDGDDLRAVGKSAVLPFDVSPIQIGTRGSAPDGRSFEVVGRVRWGWSAGSWNEWLLRCDDGSHRWLGEAMGSFMLLGEDPELLEEPSARAFQQGQLIAIGSKFKKAFAATDIKEARCIAGEGDLPFLASIDWTITSIDFRSPDGQAINLQRDSDGTTAWRGRYLALGGLQPANLRIIEGWDIPDMFR